MMPLSGVQKIPCGPGAGWTCRIDDNLDSILLPVSEDKQTLF